MKTSFITSLNTSIFTILCCIGHTMWAIENPTTGTNPTEPPTKVSIAALAGCPCKPKRGSEFTDGFQNALVCTAVKVRQYSCNYIPGTVSNDDASTTYGIEYDWADAPTEMGRVATRALVDIGGACWFNYNYNKATSYSFAPTSYTGYNSDFGRMYSWPTITINADFTERNQLWCPNNWAIPNLCDFYRLLFSMGGTPMPSLMNLNSSNPIYDIPASTGALAANSALFFKTATTKALVSSSYRNDNGFDVFNAGLYVFSGRAGIPELFYMNSASNFIYNSAIYYPQQGSSGQYFMPVRCIHQ